MSDIKIQIRQLTAQGETLLQSIPKRSDFKATERGIRARYRSNAPAESISREFISQGAGELISSIFGTGIGLGKSLTSKAIINQSRAQRDNEISQLYRQYDARCAESEQRYRSWSSEVEKAIKLTDCFYCREKFIDSQHKVKTETKLRGGIMALNQALHYLEKTPKKKSLLVKTGEPLKGRRALKDFIEKASEYIKIQEPYPTPELLEIIENTRASVKSSFLLGPFKNKEEKKKFEKNLALLRKAGRDIEIVSIKCPKNAPFHDRLIISENKGITTGTSLSGLGMRDSIITELNDWQHVELRFDEYMIGPTTKHRGNDCKRVKL